MLFLLVPIVSFFSFFPFTKGSVALISDAKMYKGF